MHASIDINPGVMERIYFLVYQMPPPAELEYAHEKRISDKPEIVTTQLEVDYCHFLNIFSVSNISLTTLTIISANHQKSPI